ncbi:hypothetical protein Hanom_Chr02g00105681 [Helianthus anomalus]
MDCASPIDDSPMMSLPVVRSANSGKEEGGGSQQMDGSEDVRESPINDVGPPQVDNPMHEENMHEENNLFLLQLMMRQMWGFLGKRWVSNLDLLWWDPVFLVIVVGRPLLV